MSNDKSDTSMPKERATEPQTSVPFPIQLSKRTWVLVASLMLCSLAAYTQVVGVHFVPIFRPLPSERVGELFDHEIRERAPHCGQHSWGSCGDGGRVLVHGHFNPEASYYGADGVLVETAQANCTSGPFIHRNTLFSRACTAAFVHELCDDLELVGATAFVFDPAKTQPQLRQLPLGDVTLTFHGGSRRFTLVADPAPATEIDAPRGPPSLRVVETEPVDEQPLVRIASLLDGGLGSSLEEQSGPNSVVVTLVPEYRLRASP